MIESVLVLNANYEPINVTNTHRAIGLILNQRASLVLNGRGYIHTASEKFPLPSIIRLHLQVSRPRIKIKLTRKEVFRRDNYTCQYCSKHSLDLTIDHVIPRHCGGKHIWTNVVTACPSCNHHKGGRSLEESGMRLLRLPKEPPTSAPYIYAAYIKENIEWEPFVLNW